MKSLLFLLFPFLIFAQTEYPDTLILKDGRSFPCLVKELNQSKIEITYANDIDRSTILQGVQRISLGTLGTVYLSDFIIDLDTIEVYMENRVLNLENEKLQIEKQRQLTAENNQMDTLKTPVVLGVVNEIKEKNKWSFGILYIPYFSGTIYTINNSSNPPYDPYIYRTVNNETNMEAQLSYAIIDELRITLDVSYTSTYYENREEYHVRQDGSAYVYDSGTFSKEDLTLLDFRLGVKYYFKNIITEKVSIYALAGIGKQLAFAEMEEKTLFREPTPSIISSQDNRNEFLEDSNSPFHFSIGFGAEYFFNESLSLNSNIRFLYSKIEAKYDSRTITEYEIYTNTIDNKESDFITRVGIGLNFYF